MDIKVRLVLELETRKETQIERCLFFFVMGNQPARGYLKNRFLKIIRGAAVVGICQQRLSIKVVTFLTLVTTDTVSGEFHLVSRCPTAAKARIVPKASSISKNL